jgi:osmotically-inducible protein OsmY
MASMMTLTKSDADTMTEVMDELAWDSRVDHEDIGVNVVDGVVTLTGSVTSYAKKLAATEAAHRVRGVLDVANDIEVRVPADSQPSDADIARSVRNALQWDVYVPHQKVESTVSGGWVTLDGEVPSWSQRNDAQRAVRFLTGVRGVTNNLRVVSPLSADEVRDAIESALERRAEREAQDVHVWVTNGKVSLSGKVDSWMDKDAIVEAAEHTPGAIEVEDRITVDPFLA